MVLTIAALELGSFGINQMGLINFSKPTYDLKISSLFEPNFHADIDPDFGVWRPNNLTKILKGDCYEATYHSNSYGARDKERLRKSDKKRVFVLGASNVEGFGVDTLNRVTNLVEKKTGIEMLNFAVAGYFSPTQQYLLYKKYHKEFDHDYVIIGITFPSAFKDDDIGVWKKRLARTDYWKWYRPYWVGEYPHYDLVYETENIEDSTFSLYPSAKKRKKEFTKSYSWFFNLLSGLTPKKSLVTKPTAGYEKASQKEIERLFFSIESILKLSKGKDILIYTIPSPGSLNLFQKGIKPNYISELEQTFNNKVSTSFLYSEEEINTSLYSNFFLPCNVHWSQLGHEEMSRILSETIGKDLQ